MSCSEVATASTTERGYGYAHKVLRAKWQQRINNGGVTCARCGKPITRGMAWDLGHTDDRTGYTGPECVRCNRAAGARKRNRLARMRRQPAKQRAW